MTILTKNLQGVKKVFGSLTKVFLLTLLALIICTCSGPKLMLGNRTLGNQIDYSTFSGKLVNQTHGLMECVILKTVGQAFHLCPQLNRSTLLQYQRIHGTEYCPNLVPMLRRCSQIKLYPSQLIIPSFSNRYRTEWTGPRPNLPTESLPPNLPVENLIPMKPLKKLPVWTPPSTGRTPATMPTMERSSGSSSMMNRVNGKGPTTSKTTGGLRKPPSD